MPLGGTARGAAPQLRSASVMTTEPPGGSRGGSTPRSRAGCGPAQAGMAASADDAPGWGAKHPASRHAATSGAIDRTPLDWARPCKALPPLVGQNRTRGSEAAHEVVERPQKVVPRAVAREAQPLAASPAEESPPALPRDRGGHALHAPAPGLRMVAVHVHAHERDLGVRELPAHLALQALELGCVPLAGDAPRRVVVHDDQVVLHEEPLHLLGGGGVHAPGPGWGAMMVADAAP